MILEITEAIHAQHEALRLEPDVLHSFNWAAIMIGGTYLVG